MPTITWSKQESSGGYNCSSYHTFTLSGSKLPAGVNIISAKLRIWAASPSSSMKLWYFGIEEDLPGDGYLWGSDTNHHNEGNSSSGAKSPSDYTGASSKDLDDEYTYEFSFSASNVDSYRTIWNRLRGLSSKKMQIRYKPSTSSSNLFYAAELDITYEDPTVTPGDPSFIYPVASTTTYNTKPWFRFKSGTDAITMYFKVDSSAWQSFSCDEDTNCSAQQWPTALSVGEHTLYIYNTSSTDTTNPAGTSGTSRIFTVAQPQTSIAAGDLFDDTIIDNLQKNINNQQAYYNISKTAFTVCNSGTTALANQINEMQDAIIALPNSSPTFSNIQAGDSLNASSFNDIRSALLKA